MISVIIIAIITCFYLITFWSINLYNLIISHRKKTENRSYAEIKRAKGVSACLATSGTLIFFIEMLGFPIAIFFGAEWILQLLALQVWFPFSLISQVMGISIMGCGWFLFLWSVLVRGQYSVSWTMTEDHKLITSGPYRYIRHPSYLGYFLMFIGFFLMWLNILALFPLLAIPGYIQIVKIEEQLLVLRFGEQYQHYQKRTGKFLPKLRK